MTGIALDTKDTMQHESFVAFATWFITFTCEIASHAESLSLSSLQLAVFASMRNQFQESLSYEKEDPAELMDDQIHLKALSQTFLSAMLPQMQPLPNRLADLVNQAYEKGMLEKATASRPISLNLMPALKPAS